MIQDFLYSKKYDFPFYRGSPQKIIALLFLPRSGSTLIACLLAQTQKFGFPLEYFARHNLCLLRERLPKLSINNLDPIFSMRTSPNGVFSYKWNNNYENDPELQKFRNRLKPNYVIVIDREDKYLQARSYALAQKTQEWVLPKSGNKSIRHEISIEDNEIENIINILINSKKDILDIAKKIGSPFMEVSYEKLLNNPHDVIENIGAFCDEKIAMRVSLNHVPIAKQNDNNTRQETRRFAAPSLAPEEKIQDHEIMLKNRKDEPLQQTSKKSLNLLLATNHLLNYTGSEITVYTLARSLLKKGHRVTVYAKYVNRNFITLFEGVASVHDDLEKLCSEMSYDVAYVQHNPVAFELRYRFQSLPMVYASLGVLPFLEQPPFLKLNIFKYLAISEEVRKNLLENGVPDERITIFRNIVDADQFVPRKTLNPHPREALIYSYKIDSEKVELIRKACKILGINCQHVGEIPGAITQAELPACLSHADIVFSLGRGVIETMMCGRVPIVYDHMGGDGLVTPENVAEIVCNNFSGRRFRRQYSIEDLVDEIRKYKSDYGPALRSIAVEQFGVDQNIDRFISIMHQACAFDFEPLTSFERKHVKVVSAIINSAKSYAEETLRISSEHQVVARGDAQTPVKVSIIIPVFNKVEYTKACINAIFENSKNILYEIIIIDNASKDSTREYLRSLENEIKVITNLVNLGFSKACNQGIRAANAPYVLFLNNDTEPQPGWLEPLVEVLDNDSSVAAVGSKLLFPDRTIQHAGVVMALHQHSGNICPFHVFYKERADLAAANRMMEYAVCTAACLIARAERLHWLGGFDECFWNGYEDVDLCLKFCQNGWRVVYQPKSVLIHYESQSGPERFSKEKQNIELLQSKWRNKAPIDVIIHPDGKISQQKDTRIKLYFDPGAQGQVSEANHSENQKNQASAFVPKLTSIIMLTFNQLQYTQECVESIQKNTSEPYEIVFVDNGSSDGTVKWLRTLAKKNSNFRLIENSKNLGFSKGCNQGIEASKGEYILLLNNDVVVSEKWLGRMLECLNSTEDIGIVGPMTNQISGPQKVPEIGYTSIEGLNAYAQLFGEKNRYRRVFYARIVGFCMLFKRGLAEKIGLFDERFGSGNFEDDDYCLRASLAGYRNVIAGDVFVHHHGSRSFIGNRIDYRRSLVGNRKIFNDKWSGKEIAQRYGNNLLILGAIHRADDFYRKGQLEKAISSLLAAMKQTPGDKRLYFALAEMLIDSKRFHEAFELLEAMPQGDSDARKLILTGCCEDGLGRCDQAEAWAEQALGLEPAMPQALNLKGIAVYKRGEKGPAKRFFLKAIEADPSYGESYTNLGVLKWDAGEQTDALSLFERGFILSPTSADALTAYHSAVSDAGTFAQAEPVLREAKALCPNDRRIAYFLIATLIQQQKHHAAMDEIEQVIAKFGMEEGMISAALDIRAKIGPHGVGKGGPEKSTLSLCMIVKNEEAQLPRCLMSAKSLVDEIIVVDTGSNDRTRDIAKVFGAKVFDFPWSDNFAEARNFSIAQASGNWVLILDADEALSPNDHAVLRKPLSKQRANRAAYRMTTRNYTDEAGSRGWVENEGKCPEQEAGRGWFPSSKVRLFPKHPAIQFENPVHEMVEPSLRKGGWPIKDCEVPIHHYGKLSREKVIEKGKAYYRLGLQKLDQMQGDYDALKELAIQASEIGAYEEAVKIWHLVIGLAPEDAGAFMNLGYSYLMLNQFDKAMEHSRKALALNPASREAALNLSAAELIAGDLDSAAQMLDQLLTREPNYPPALGRLAAACILRGRKFDGLQCLNRLKEKGFEGGGILAEQAQEFYQAGKINQAILLLETSIEGGMETPAIRSALDRCRSKLAFRENDDSLAGRAANHPFDQTEITAVQPLAL